MSENTPVWDLGEIGSSGETARPLAAPTVQRTAVRRPGASPTRVSGIDWAAGLSVVVPGTAGLLRGRTSEGLFFLTGLGFVASLGWACLNTLDRLADTLVWLGLPPASAVWCLGLLFFFGMVLHVLNVAASGPGGSSAPPAPISGLASALVPGWGQALNGDLGRAVVFLCATWTVGASWLLASPWVTALLADRNLVLPPMLEDFSSLPARAAMTAALWAVAVYDAAQRSASIRD
jgi:hypothetical protein